MNKILGNSKVVYGATTVATAMAAAAVFAATMVGNVSANTIADYSSLTTAVQDEFTGALPVILPVIGVLLAIGIVITVVMRRSRAAGK